MITSSVRARKPFSSAFGQERREKGGGWEDEFGERRLKASCFLIEWLPGAIPTMLAPPPSFLPAASDLYL
ncbi:hypothetical protein E2C01_007948 [Portunus trituberculatus]|uniref:Uncharacterized protein n=1 Tax=Portunus trituberculatus TaxID=210409 RepID=A0A5B7D2L3_PORTR|nr:hypothetical protein [Portunus trituberculatus]